MDGSTTLWIVRHAESEANIPGFRHIKNPSLSPTGEQQAQDLGEYFNQHHIQFDALYTSGRNRANRTAEIIERQLNMTAHIMVDDRLKERREGINYTPQDTDIESLADRFEGRLAGMDATSRWDYTPDDPHVDLSIYETDRDAASRFQDALVTIAHDRPGQTILVIGHMMVMTAHIALLRTHKQWIKEYPAAKVFDDIHIHNTGFYVLNAIFENESIVFKTLEVNFEGIKPEHTATKSQIT